MPRETFRGSDIPSLMASARIALGADAAVIAVRRLPAADGSGFELDAADPATAASATRNTAEPKRGLMGMRPGRALLHARQGNGPGVMALVGPTGAGKTTTIAKLATNRRVFGGMGVGLLCLDTYRVGAEEQLRVYAELARLPMAVAYEPREVAKALARFSDLETVLVDTAGRGPRQHDDAEAAAALLREAAPAEVHLALPAGLDPRHARRVLARHRPFGVTHLLLTKTDEFPEDTVVMDLALERGLPMRWLTDGQEVPGDLQNAQAAVLAAAESRAPNATVALAGAM